MDLYRLNKRYKIILGAFLLSYDMTGKRVEREGMTCSKGLQAGVKPAAAAED